MEEYSQQFLANWLQKLPWPVIKEIFLLLPSHILLRYLVRVPQFRDFIIELYYNDELHLIVSPVLRGHSCVDDSQRREMRDIVSYGEIDDFLHQNPDINPVTYKVISSHDFRSLEILLEKYHDRFSSSNNLEIIIDQYELTADQLNFLFSFKNLRKLQTSRVSFKSTKNVLAQNLRHLQSLKELVFLGSAISDWSEISLPVHLEHLDVSWFINVDVLSFNIPETLVNLYWNQVGLVSSVFSQLRFPSNLQTLMLSYNSLDVINVSSLPQSLRTIDLSFNGLKKFEYTEGEALWPPNLESIMLHNNFLDDTTLKQLKLIKWPNTLRNLRLDTNYYTTLENLNTLPSGLRYLDLSESHLTTLRVEHNQCEYPYFVFPESLETLNILCCRNLNFDNHSLPNNARIKFPDNLQTFNLIEANCDNLSHFLFPKSLKSLGLSGNRIKDLNTYNLRVNDQDIINWEQLTNLKELDVFFNLICGLKHWKPPGSLRKLDLRKNNFKTLTSVDTPLFNKGSEKPCGLQVLRLDDNSIHTIDMEICFPPQMHTLNLSGNLLSQFNFTAALGNHPSLKMLDLSNNQIEKLSLIPNESKYCSNIKTLILTRNRNLGVNWSLDDFYTAMEQLSLTPMRRKRNLKTEHLFV